MIRSLLERLCAPLVFPRRLPADFARAKFYTTGAAGLRYLFRTSGQIDANLLRNARETIKPGDVVWDVGANVGLFSLAAAVLSGPDGKVIAFEPDTDLIRLLRRTAAIQPETFAPITIVPTAIAAQPGTRHFAIAKRSRASNALIEYGMSQMGGIREVRKVQADTLDSMLERYEPPQVLKIDVEGADLEVFRGAEKLLSQHRPILLFETWKRLSKPVTTLIHSYSYTLYSGLVEKQHWQEIPEAIKCTIGIPSDQSEKISA